MRFKSTMLLQMARFVYFWLSNIPLCMYVSNLPYPFTCQYNPYQNTNGIFPRTRTNNFEIHMATQKTPNIQNNPEKKEEN